MQKRKHLLTMRKKVTNIDVVKEDDDITERELTKAINKIKNDKAAGKKLSTKYD